MGRFLLGPQMLKVKFTTSGANSAFGGFSSGDVLVCSEAMARHLVDDLHVAKYAETAQQEANEPAKPKRNKGNK